MLSKRRNPRRGPSFNLFQRESPRHAHAGEEAAPAPRPPRLPSAPRVPEAIIHLVRDPPEENPGGVYGAAKTAGNRV